MDVTTVLGIAIGIGCILVGQFLEGGHAGSMVQGTAAIIVLGGTLGAVVTQFPRRELRRGVRVLQHALIERALEGSLAVERLVALARHSQHKGLLQLGDELGDPRDPFYESAVSALIEGHASPQLRSLLDAQIQQEQREQEAGPRMLEAAGGYAPTIGVLGAVLGLIHVMENLSEPDRLGAGIAVAFVATVYGVATANLVFLPLAQKLRSKLESETHRKELILEGICAIQEGMPPKLLARKLHALLGSEP